VKLALTLALVLALPFACTAEGRSGSGQDAAILSPAPAPHEDVGLNGECVVGLIRADRVDESKLLDLLGPHRPTLLPEGFGLLIGWQGANSPGGLHTSIGGIWTDQACRQIRLEVFVGAEADEAPMPDGEWTVIGRGTCTFGGLRNAPCVDYHAQADGDAISLSLTGLSQNEVAHVLSGLRPA
jgi:hypothetical protein